MRNDNGNPIPSLFTGWQNELAHWAELPDSHAHLIVPVCMLTAFEAGPSALQLRKRFLFRAIDHDDLDELVHMAMNRNFHGKNRGIAKPEQTMQLRLKFAAQVSSDDTLRFGGAA